MVGRNTRVMARQIWDDAICEELIGTFLQRHRRIELLLVCCLGNDTTA